MPGGGTAMSIYYHFHCRAFPLQAIAAALAQGSGSTQANALSQAVSQAVSEQGCSSIANALARE